MSGSAGDMGAGAADLARVRRLLADAEGIARGISTPAVGSVQGFRSSALRRIVAVLVAFDPDDAERVARDIADPGEQAMALKDVGGALAESDPEQARVLFEDAVRLVRTIRPRFLRGALRAEIAVTLAALDSGEGERLARTVTDSPAQVSTLVRVAGLLVEAEPERSRGLLADAERLARSLDKPDEKRALSWIAGQLARLDPEGAERLARRITERYAQGRALREVAATLAPVDLAGAERIASSIAHPLRKAQALAIVAGALAGADPTRARRLLAEAEHAVRAVDAPWFQARTVVRIADVLAGLDPEEARRLLIDAENVLRTTSHAEPVLEDAAAVMAKVDPADAERLAHSIHRPPVHRFRALQRIAEQLATVDPDEAERVARSITTPYGQSLALTAIAKALINGT